MKRTALAARSLRASMLPVAVLVSTALASALVSACGTASPGADRAAGPAGPGASGVTRPAAAGNAATARHHGARLTGRSGARLAGTGSSSQASAGPIAPRALPAGFIVGTVVKDLGTFDRAIRRRANLRVMFVKMGGSYFPRKPILQNERLGAQTVLELQPSGPGSSMSQIALGSEDAWLQNVFDPNVTALRRIVTVSFAPEMNGQWYSYGTGRATPADYVNAWRHIHDLIMTSSAGRFITWMWQPSAIHFSTPSPRPWWPGWRYVDEVGLDGYYIVPTDNFDAIFARTIKIIRSLTKKPILIGETSVGPLTAHQGADIQNLFAGIRRYHLRGLVWFNIPQSRGRYHQDWRLQDHPLALDEYIAQVTAAAG